MVLWQRVISIAFNFILVWQRVIFKVCVMCCDLTECYMYVVFIVLWVGSV